MCSKCWIPWTQKEHFTYEPECDHIDDYRRCIHKSFIVWSHEVSQWIDYTVSNLIAFTYVFHTAIISFFFTFSTSMFLSTAPAPPQNVTVTNVTEQSITISWTPGAGYRTRYHLHAYATSYSEEVGVVHGDDTDFTFHDLLAGTRYIITIRASANFTDGDMVPIGETTLPTSKNKRDTGVARPFDQSLQTF